MPMPKGFKVSQQTKDKISKTLTGCKRGSPSLEHRHKNRLAHLGKKHSAEVRKRMGVSRMSHITSEETRLKISEARKKQAPPRTGPMSEEHKRKIGLANSGENSPNWKGGITPIHCAIRNSAQYKAWRQAVFERDKFSCVECGQLRGRIEADHIKRF